MIPMTPRRSHCHWGRWIFRCVGVTLKKRDFEEPRVLRCNGTLQVHPREDVWYKMTHVWLSLQVTQRSRDLHPEGWNMLHAHLSAHEQKHPLRYSNTADWFVLQRERAAVIYIIYKLHFFKRVCKLNGTCPSVCLRYCFYLQLVFFKWATQ